jgi:hypothetical protein
MSAAENVIGGILVSGKDAYWRVADLLRPEDFPTAYLANLYRVCGEVAKSPSVLDVFSVGASAEQQGEPDVEPVEPARPRGTGEGRCSAPPRAGHLRRRREVR